MIARKTAIVGIGATEFSKNSGRTEMKLAVECVKAALDDAGLTGADVDGMSTFTMDNNPEIEIFRQIGGKELKMFSRIHYGGGAACGPVVQAAMAIASGVCEVVVVYRAMNERSGHRFGAGGLISNDPLSPDLIHFSWYFPSGFLTPASWIAMTAQRYMHDYGVTTEDFGRVVVSVRDFASTNPKAFFYNQPITLEDHQNSRWICEPLRLFDCCQESDGGQALVITSAERARNLKKKPVIVKAASQAATNESQMMTPFYNERITQVPEMSMLARELYDQSGLGPNDFQTAVLYDHFSPTVLMQLEEFGFCGRGEARDFIRDGHISRDGKLPVNTNGGQIGEAYIHGVNGIAEGVRQVRGEAVNQVDNVEHVLVTAGQGVPSGGLILGAA